MDAPDNSAIKVSCMGPWVELKAIQVSHIKRQVFCSQ